ncbi:MAG: helix-turn-helix transcriptional regulator [Bacteroidota bacterium]
MASVIPIHSLAHNNTSPYTARKLNPFNGPHEAEDAHRHTYYEILVFVEGAGTQMIDFEVQDLKPNSIHFISPGQVHALNRMKEAEGYVVNFTKEFMLLNGGNMLLLNDFAFFSRANKHVVKIPADEFSEILVIIKQMLNKKIGSSPLKESVLAAYVNLLLIKYKALFINSSKHKQTDESGKELIQRFNNLLEESFIVAHNVTYYAEKLNFSPNYLSSLLKKLTGKTAGDLIQQRLLLEAKRMLLHSSITIKEIAYLLNFNDPPYFTRFFKSNTGYTPETFRRETRRKYSR